MGGGQLCVGGGSGITLSRDGDHMMVGGTRPNAELSQRNLLACASKAERLKAEWDLFSPSAFLPKRTDKQIKRTCLGRTERKRALLSIFKADSETQNIKAFQPTLQRQIFFSCNLCYLSLISGCVFCKQKRLARIILPLLLLLLSSSLWTGPHRDLNANQHRCSTVCLCNVT